MMTAWWRLLCWKHLFRFLSTDQHAVERPFTHQSYSWLSHHLKRRGLWASQFICIARHDVQELAKYISMVCICFLAWSCGRSSF
jgi:hypothetical protein